MAYFTIEGYNSYSGCDITVTASLPPINGEVQTKYYSLGSLQTLSISTHQDKRPVRSLGVINAKDYVMGPRTIAGSMVFAVFNKHFATEIMNDLGAGSGYNVVLPDEIPALNITVNFANEYGRMSRMAIYGVKIINEGQVMSINDLYTENTYQFVALGLEPLNVNINTDGSDDKNKIPVAGVEGTMIPGTVPGLGSEATYNVPTLKNRMLNYGYIDRDAVLLDTTNSTSALLNNTNFLNNSGANISDQIQNNAGLSVDQKYDSNIDFQSSPILLTVSIEQPQSANDLGIATFELDPKKDQGVIYIYHPNNESNKELTLNVSSKSILIVSLPVGKYKAQYIDITSDVSNVVDFTIEKYVDSTSSVLFEEYPIVEKVSNTYITITKTNYNHTIITCFEEGSAATIINSDKRIVTIENLKPNTIYNIFTSDGSGTRSQIITVKTYEHENEELLILKDFLETNKNMLIAAQSTNVFNNIDYSKYNTPIDMVLDMPESHEKQELLIYATELTNQLVASHNEKNNLHIINDLQETPFTSMISLNDFDAMNIYTNINKRSAITAMLNNSIKEFCGKPNCHYTAQGVSSNGIHSVKKNFVVCKNSSYIELERYRNTNMYKKLDYSDYLSRYKNYNFDTIEHLMIRDNFYSDINLLEPPYIYQTDFGEIYADINYLKLNKYETYYLCCAEIYDALDYKPVRKIEFSLDTITDELELRRFYLGLNKNKQYLFWIENFNFIKISKPFLFVSAENSEYKEVKEIYQSQLYSKLLTLKKEMIKAYGNKTVINDLFDYIYSIAPAQKNLDTVIIIELINRLSGSYYVSNTFTPLYELINILHTYDKIIDLPKVQWNKKERTIQFEELKGYRIKAITYTDSEATRIIEDDVNRLVKYDEEGYTMIFLSSSNMLYKTGFILIDNIANKIKATSDLIDLIKEVGDK